MDIFRIKHLPTGLYYTPSRGSGNLSAKGKMYVGRRPSLDWVGTSRVQIHGGLGRTTKQQILISHFNIQPSGVNSSGDPIYWVNEYFNTPKEEWEIQLYTEDD